MDKVDNIDDLILDLYAEFKIKECWGCQNPITNSFKYHTCCGSFTRADYSAMSSALRCLVQSGKITEDMRREKLLEFSESQ